MRFSFFHNTQNICKKVSYIFVNTLKKNGLVLSKQCNLILLNQPKLIHLYELIYMG